MAADVETTLRLIPPGTLDEYRELFDELDTDGNERLDFEEFSAIVDDLDMKASQQELFTIFEALDVDSSNDIDFAEFATLMWSLQRISNDNEETDEPQFLKKSSSVSFLYRLWAFLEYPSTSKGAKFVSFFILALIILSCVSFVLESLKSLDKYSSEFNFIEIFCVAFFTIEFVLRVLSCPSQKKFWSTLLNWIDFLAIMPVYVQMVLDNQGVNPVVMRILRLVRIFRVMKLSKHMAWLRLLSASFMSSLIPIMMGLFLMGLVLLLISAAMFELEKGTFDESLNYYVNEDGEKSDFQSIPHTFWWAIITMTNVGYGDDVPVTWHGQSLAAATSLLGVVCVAIPVSIFGTSFTYHYEAMQRRKALAHEGVSDLHNRMMMKVKRQKQQEAMAKAQASPLLSVSKRHIFRNNYKHTSTRALQQAVMVRNSKDALDGIKKAVAQRIDEERKKLMLECRSVAASCRQNLLLEVQGKWDGWFGVTDDEPKSST
eukprot:TRINITY_DN5152_c0_g2_i1.p1 TRINITY_DN5152_c0_g2~~TRINITY_DN5152_c0_g2_i1.p1  ORF type:complete len:487 (-),score=116.00 TRINITY_DN5152_c0_g2_i1:90-1550(-)